MKKRVVRLYPIARYVIYRQTILEPADHFWTFLGAFTAIASIGLLQQARFSQQDDIFLIPKTMHPPAGATALIANIGSEKIKSLGFAYTLSPVLTGITILLLIALIINNIPSGRSYPATPLPWFRKKNNWRNHLQPPKSATASLEPTPHYEEN